MEEQEILTYDPNIKNKLKRFIRDFNNKFFNSRKEEFLNFNKSYLTVSKILNSTELFPVIHPKKGSQITGKWSYGLLKVVNFLANFEYEQVLYGVEFLHLLENYSTFP